jgi:sialidase-1
MASICRLSKESPDGKNRILFSNPANLEVAEGKAEPGKKRDRQNLTIRMSYDEGRKWPVAKTLEKGPSAYSDLGVAPDGTIYCLYERSTKVNDALASTLTLARFNLEWLSDGKDKFERAAAP